MEHPTATKTKSSEGFIDGDLVEHFLDLPQDKMEEICKGIKVELHVQSTRNTPTSEAPKMKWYNITR